jgi:hypothetical protein
VLHTVIPCPFYGAILRVVDEPDEVDQVVVMPDPKTHAPSTSAHRHGGALLAEVMAAARRAAPDPTQDLVKNLVEQAIAGTVTFDSNLAKSLGDAVAGIDRVLGGQLDLITHHPRFLRLKAAWDGLHALVNSGPPGGLRVRVLDIPSSGQAAAPSQPFEVLIEVRPSDNPAQTAEAATLDASATEADFQAAMGEARARGEVLAATLLSGADMLGSNEFAALIGVSREGLHRKRLRHEVLGLEGAKRGYRFPKWQLTREGLLPGLPEVFARLDGNPWAVIRFLRQHHPELGGQTALQALRAGKVAQVLGAAENAGRGFS